MQANIKQMATKTKTLKYRNAWTPIDYENVHHLENKLDPC